MGPQNVATLRPLVIIGYALGVTDIVLACYTVARVFLGRRPLAGTFRKWSRRSQTLFYLVIWLLIVPSLVLLAIGLYAPSALFTDIGAIGMLTDVLILAIVGLL